MTVGRQATFQRCILRSIRKRRRSTDFERGASKGAHRLRRLSHNALCEPRGGRRKSGTGDGCCRTATALHGGLWKSRDRSATTWRSSAGGEAVTTAFIWPRSGFGGLRKRKHSSGPSLLWRGAFGSCVLSPRGRHYYARGSAYSTASSFY